MVGTLRHILYEFLLYKIFVFEVVHQKVVLVGVCSFQCINDYDQIPLLRQEAVESFETVLQVCNVCLESS